VSGRASGEGSASADPLVVELREQISRVDRELLAAVNRRLEIVRRLHDHKLANGIPLRDPEREASLLSRLAAENGGPLSARGVGELFAYLLELTRRELHGA
jgi:chorismate mutase / prephenate dehydratase